MAAFTNQATLSYNNTVRQSNVATGEIVEVLSGNKTALRGTYTNGDTVTYVINLINSGNAPLTNLTVTDDLGSYPVGTENVTPLTVEEGSVRLYENGIPQAAPTVVPGPPLAFSGITVPANGETTIVYQALANGFAPLGNGGSIVNTATATGAALTQDVPMTATVNFASEPDLSIEKALSPTTVSENGQLTYTFTIRNNGSEDAGENANVTVTDVFDPILTNLTVTLNGQTLTEGTDYTYDTATGTFSTIPGRITVPAANYSQNAATGVYTASPGASTLTVTGTVS